MGFNLSNFQVSYAREQRCVSMLEQTLHIFVVLCIFLTVFPIVGCIALQLTRFPVDFGAIYHAVAYYHKLFSIVQKIQASWLIASFLVSRPSHQLSNSPHNPPKTTPVPVRILNEQLLPVRKPPVLQHQIQTPRLLRAERNKGSLNNRPLGSHNRQTSILI